MIDPVVMGKDPGGAVAEILTAPVDDDTTGALDVLDTSFEEVPVWAKMPLGVLELAGLVAVELVKMPTLVGLDMLAFPLSVCIMAEAWELDWVIVVLLGD